MPITAAAGDAFAHKFAKQFAAGFAGNNHAVQYARNSRHRTGVQLFCGPVHRRSPGAAYVPGTAGLRGSRGDYTPRATAT